MLEAVRDTLSTSFLPSSLPSVLPSFLPDWPTYFMLVGPHPGGAGTTRDHARQLDTAPVGVAQEFSRYWGGDILRLYIRL